MFKNTWDIFRQTVAKEGFFALYKGKLGSAEMTSGADSQRPRYGLATARYRRRELSALHRLWRYKTYHLALPRLDHGTDCDGWSRCRCDQCRSGESCESRRAMLRNEDAVRI